MVKYFHINADTSDGHFGAVTSSLGVISVDECGTVSQVVPPFDKVNGLISHISYFPISEDEYQRMSEGYVKRMSQGMSPLETSTESQKNENYQVKNR